MSVLRSNPWSHLHPAYTCDQIHGLIYTLVLFSVVGSNSCSHLHPVLVIKSMVPCTYIVRFTPCTCDQIHGPIYTQSVLVIKSMVPFTPLYFSLLWGQTHAHIYTCTFVCCGVNPWSDLHLVLVIKSMVPSCT